METLKNKKGITIIVLIFTIIIMLILAAVSITFSRKGVDKARLEDIKINMLLLQGKSKTIYEKYSFKEIEKLAGIEYNPQNNSTSYIVSTELNEILVNQEGAKFYIWEQKDFQDNGLGEIKIDEREFYIVNYETGEIYYSLGYTKDGSTYYALTDIQEL